MASHQKPGKQPTRNVARRKAKSSKMHLFRLQRRLLGDTIPQPCIFDVGAHYGETARHYRRVFPNARIFCFEPFPDSFAKLATVTDKIQGVECLQTAIGADSGQKTLHVNSRAVTNSLFPRPSASVSYFPSDALSIGETTVDVVTIDQVCRSRNLQTIDILKLDIQGAELDALRGAASLLSKGSIRLIFCEVMFVAHYEGGALFHEVAQFLTGHGYSLYDLCLPRRASNGQLRFADALFLSPETRKALPKPSTDRHVSSAKLERAT